MALADCKDKQDIAVVFIGAECRFVNLHVSRLAEFQHGSD